MYLLIEKETPMTKVLILLYGFVAYAFFFFVFLYAIGFTGNMIVPRSIDAGGTAGIGILSIVINLALLSVFAVQHSLMARPEFKKVWTKIIPKPIERSTYVLLSSAALALLFWQWQAFATPVWDLTGSPFAIVLQSLFWFGWLFVLASTFQFNHFELFGLAQIWSNFKGKNYGDLKFRTPVFYQFVRHPIMVGFIIAFWAAPVMSQGHLMFAVITTAYIWIALYLEERDLVNTFGAEYTQYQDRVGKLVPKLKKPEPTGTQEPKADT
jgi:methanethiol S-methyltransferase